MAHLEQNFRKAVIRAMQLQSFDCTPHEDKSQADIPDMSYSHSREANGWIELKCLDIPKREDTHVPADHFTPGQRAWLNRRGRHGQNCWLLVKFSDGAVAVFGHWGQLAIGRVTYATIKRIARHYWPPKTPAKTIVAWFAENTNSEDHKHVRPILENL